MCAPISAEELARWRAEAVRQDAAKMAKLDAKRRLVASITALSDDELFLGRKAIAKIDAGFESRSYEQRFLRFVAARRERELVRVRA